MNWEQYQVGRRVVCITEYTPYVATICSAVPVKGRVYTIRSLEMGNNQTGELVLGLQFEEFESYRIGDFADIGGTWHFRAVDFRPLDENRLDQFRLFLAPAPKEGVPA